MRRCGVHVLEEAGGKFATSHHRAEKPRAIGVLLVVSLDDDALVVCSQMDGLPAQQADNSARKLNPG